MQAFKYSLRLMLCKPVLAMLGAVFVVFIALSLVASVFVASLSWQAALLAGAKFGGILAGALWAMFFMKTYMAVSAASSKASMDEYSDGPVGDAKKETAVVGEVGESIAKKTD